MFGPIKRRDLKSNARGCMNQISCSCSVLSVTVLGLFRTCSIPLKIFSTISISSYFSSFQLELLLYYPVHFLILFWFQFNTSTNRFLLGLCTYPCETYPRSARRKFSKH